MNTKATTRVNICGKTYNLSGFEDEEYLLQVAAYIESRINEVISFSGYNRLPEDLKVLMTEINIADDYFKARNTAEANAKSADTLSKEVYELKQKLVDLEIRGFFNAASGGSCGVYIVSGKDAFISNREIFHESFFAIVCDHSYIHVNLLNIRWRKIA